MNLKNFFRPNYVYKEDHYDRLMRMEQGKDNYFTNKAKMKKIEFDYEEDPYEPIIDEDFDL